MKINKLYSICLLVSVGLLGCSGGSESRVDNQVPYYMSENYSGIRSELRSADFYCATSGLCPKNVGLLYTNLDGSSYRPKIAQCTGFLIGDDIVATNSHCIPDRLKVSGVSCDSQIAIRFLNGSGQKSIFGCKEILDYSPLGALDPDYAFMRVESTGISPLPLHKNGVKDNEEITVAKVTPLPSSPGGRLEIEYCKVGIGTLLNVKSVSSWSKTAVGLGCQAIGGNSGSPVLNREGQVIGILQSKMLDSYSRLIKENFKQLKLDVPDSISPHILFTSFSCVKDPVAGHPNEAKCKSEESLNIVDCFDFDNAKSEENGKQLFERWKASLSSLFVYEYVTDEATLTTQAHPICVKPKEKSPDYEKFVALKGIIGFRKEHLSVLYPKAVVIGGKLVMDSEYRLSPELRFTEEHRAYYQVDLVKEGETWSGTMNSTFSERRFNVDFSKMKLPVTLKDCTEAQIAAKELSQVKLKTGETLTEAEYKLRQPKKEKKVCEK